MNMSNSRGPLFLRGSKMLLETLKKAVIEDDSKYVYIIGKDTKFIVNNVLKAIADTDEYKKNLYIVLHSLTSKEFSSTSFLYLISKLGERIRISEKASHNLIVTETALIFASAGYESEDGEDDWVCGVAIYDKAELEKAEKYCQELWEKGYALSLQ